MSARCEAELCQYWTGDGCACAVFGIERPAPDEDKADEDEAEQACEVCGDVFDGATSAERCLDCEVEQ